MEKIDFRIHANFMGEYVILSPNNGRTREELQDAYDELQELADITKWYNKQKEKIESDERLKDETREKKLSKLEEEFTKKAKKFQDGLQQHRKRVCNIMIDEWKAGQPEDDFYSNRNFDDFALNRLLEFFLNPSGLKPEQSNGSST